VQRIDVVRRQSDMALTRLSFLGAAICGVIRAARQPGGARTVEEAIFVAVNRERRARRLPALNWNDQLADAARRHSSEMERRRFLSHHDPRRGNLTERLARAGIDPSACAENLYAQSREDGVAEAAVRAWLRSRGHRANLLNGVYRETAIGVASGRGGHISVTQIFIA
jgi:uncharacterized protein YkwD